MASRALQRATPFRLALSSGEAVILSFLPGLSSHLAHLQAWKPYIVAMHRAALFFAFTCTVLLATQFGEELPGQRYEREGNAAAEALQKGNLAEAQRALTALRRDFPNNARALRNLAAVEARLGHSEAAGDLVRTYSKTGLTLDTGPQTLAPLRDIVAAIPELQNNASSVSQASRVFPAPASDLIVEDIAFDSATKTFYLSSIRQSKILRCDLQGKCTDFVKSTPELRLGAVLALRADPKRGILWATSAGMNAAANFRKEDDGNSSALKFDLRSGRLIKAYRPSDNQKHAMGDMTVSSTGEAFISDGLSGDVFVISPNHDVLEPLVPGGVFVSPQTPALSADEKILYVPDYIGAIAAVRLSDRHVDWLTSIVPAAFDGIDGMYLVNGKLIAVQNGTTPERITAFHLASPVSVDRFDVLEANWKGLGDPTHGVIVGNEFYFIANSGWNRVGDDGKLEPGDNAVIMKRKIE